MQFDVLNSKIQEFWLNKMVCLRDSLFITHDLSITLGSTCCNKPAATSKGGISLTCCLIEPKFL